MNQQIAKELIEALESIEERMLAQGMALFDASLIPYAARGQLLERRKQFNVTAGRWQHETQELLKQLRLAGGDVVIAPYSSDPLPLPHVVVLPAEQLALPVRPTESVRGRTPGGMRLGLSDSWQDHHPHAFCLWNEHVQSTNSIRETYRIALQMFSDKHTSLFIPKILAHKRVAPLAFQKEPHTYTTPSISIQGYAFNTNLSAESLKEAIRFLYDAFGMDRAEFGMWVE